MKLLKRCIKAGLWSCVFLIGALVVAAAIGALAAKVPIGIVILAMFGTLFMVVYHEIN